MKPTYALPPRSEHEGQVAIAYTIAKDTGAGKDINNAAWGAADILGDVQTALQRLGVAV